MKQIFEVGDRVKLVDAEYITKFIGSTGEVSYVHPTPDEDGDYTVSFILDAESQQRMQKSPGYIVTANSVSLKYLKPKKEKNKAAKLDAKLAEKLDKLAETMIPLVLPDRESKLTIALSLALNALGVIDDTNSAGYNPTLKEIKKAMLVELR
jgi:hypothetical protein